MTHNNNQRRFSLKTQARKGTAALLSIALIAALTGCESLSYMGNAVQTAGGYAFDKAEAGYRAVEGLETKTVGRVRSSNFAQTRDEALSMKVQAKSLYLRASANGSGLTDESIESANKFLLSQGPIRRQVLTVVPLSERGEKLARRLAEALEEAGAQEPKLASAPVRRLRATCISPPSAASTAPPSRRHLRANGGVAAGQIEYQPKAENGRGFLSVKLNRLNLPELPAAEDKPQNVTNPVPPQAPEPSTLRVSDLPDISLVIDELSWGKRRIGKMELAAAADDPLTWRIQNLTIRNPGATISAQGAWSTTALDPVGRTSASFKANVINAGTLLTSLDVKDAVHDAPGNADFQLSWAGHPGAFNTPTLSGRFHASAGAGQLLQVEPGAGRLLSLMSMQHLLQRLTLDFRDVLSKGFRFDSFRSEGTINNGVLHFTKSTVAGSAATVVIQGDANFVTNLLDIKALVLPSLNGEAASLAVAIANPAIGIGSLIAQWMFKDQISSILSSEYSIAGPIDDPIVKKVESFGTRVERLEDRAKDAVKGTVRKQTHENQ